MLELIIGLLWYSTSPSGPVVEETVAGYLQTDVAYALVEMDGQAVTVPASIQFGTDGGVHGSAPCNTWSATQSAPYPWFELSPIISTRSICPDIDVEQAFFETLGRMTLAEVSGPILILSTTDGAQMVFQISD